MVEYKDNSETKLKQNVSFIIFDTAKVQQNVLNQKIFLQLFVSKIKHCEYTNMYYFYNLLFISLFKELKNITFKTKCCNILSCFFVAAICSYKKQKPTFGAGFENNWYKMLRKPCFYRDFCEKNFFLAKKANFAAEIKFNPFILSLL